MNIFVYGLETFGMVAVCLCFVVLMPNVGVILSLLFGLIMGEQGYSRLQGVESGTEMNLDDEGRSTFNPDLSASA